MSMGSSHLTKCLKVGVGGRGRGKGKGGRGKGAGKGEGGGEGGRGKGAGGGSKIGKIVYLRPTFRWDLSGDLRLRKEDLVSDLIQ